MTEPILGAPFRWIPAAFTAHGEDSSGAIGSTVYVNGRITMINDEHRWFRAEASFPGGTIRECFKF